MSKFEAQTDFNEKHATADIKFKAGPGFWQSVSGSDRKYWSDQMKSVLGIGGFPVELSLNSHQLLPVPAVQFEENPEGISELFNKKINIFVSPTEYYNIQLRQPTPNMKLGVNNSVNLERKKVGARLMDGGPSKIDRPTSHPSNPIHPNSIHKDKKLFNPHKPNFRKPKVREIMKF